MVVGNKLSDGIKFEKCISAQQNCSEADFTSTSRCALLLSEKDISIIYTKFFHTPENIAYSGDIIIEVYANSYSELSELAQSKEFFNRFFIRLTGGYYL